MPSQFLVRALPSERPRDATLVGIAAQLPGVDFGNERGAVRQTPVQTLAIEDADLDFSHIEPTGVFRSVVKDDAAQKCPRLFDAEHFLEALAEVGIEVVHDQMNSARRGIDLFEQISDEG